MSGLVCPGCGRTLVRDMAASIALTRRQRAVLDAIVAAFAEDRETPSLRSLANELGLKSKAQVHPAIERLRELGLVQPIQPGVRPPLAPTEKAWRLYGDG